jgi:hypothetical protein
VRHALCKAHPLRERKALSEIEQEDRASRMQHPLRRACHASNLAREQDARKLEPRSGSSMRQKVSGGFRCDDGAEDFAVVRSALPTARKQGWDILQTLTRGLDRLIPDLRAVRQHTETWAVPKKE